MKKAITASAILFAALIAYATMTGDLNTWLGYMAGEDATGERTTVQGAGAGGGASYLYRTELIGAASGVYGYWFQDTVGIGYRALRHSSYMTNVIAIGSHALEGVQGMGTMADVTWIGGHFVANPPNPDPTMGLSQVPGEFYITGDASKTNSLAPIWYDGSNLWLNAEQIVTPSGSISGGANGFGYYGDFYWNNISYYGFYLLDDQYSYTYELAAPFEAWNTRWLLPYLPDETAEMDRENWTKYVRIASERFATEAAMDARDTAISYVSDLLSTNVYDFATDAGVKAALRDIVKALGGTVVN